MREHDPTCEIIPAARHKIFDCEIGCDGTQCQRIIGPRDYIIRCGETPDRGAGGNDLEDDDQRPRGKPNGGQRYPPAVPALTILSVTYLRVAALASHILVVLLALGSVLAGLRLTTSSKVVGCWAGRWAGFAPLGILPT